MGNEKLKMFAVLTLVVGLIGGYLYGSSSGYNQGYSVGYTKAQGEIKQRLVDTKLIEPAPREVKIISGTIKSLGDSQFVLESRLPFDPTLPTSEQGKTVIRTVKVVASTNITVRTIQVSNQRLKPGEPIRPFVVNTIKSNFKAIKVGSQIIVEAAENIANVTQFEAKTIFLNGQ